MKKILVFLFFLYQCSLYAQIVSWGPGTFVWTRNAPVHNPGSGGAKFAVDTTTFQVYEWISGTSWQSSGQRVEEISGTGAPAYTPGKHDSYIVVNKKTPNPELYYYFSGSWKLIGGGGGGGTSYTAGEGIAIDGTVIRIDTLDRLSFNTLPTLPGGIGTFRWNDTDGTLDLGMKGGNVTLQVGQESLARVVNKSGTTINNGQVVYISGAQGNRIAVRIASASSDSTTNTVLGIATEEILNNQEGYVTTEGLVRGINTSAFPEGSALYLSPTVPGGITATLPTAPNHEVVVGYCVRQHATVGIIYASVENGEGLNELHDVKLTSPTNGQVLTYNSGSKWWENSTPTTGTVTSVGLSLPSIFSVSGSPVITSGTLTGTLATQTANTIFAGPTTGAAAAPTFRSLVAADVTAAGGLIGTGVTNQVPYFSSTTGITSEAGSTTNAFTWDAANNRLGIAKIAPARTLDVSGDIQGSADLYLGTAFKLYDGGNLFFHKTGSTTTNMFLGYLSGGGLVTTGVENIAIGNTSAYSLTSGANNTAIGKNTLLQTTTGAGNVAIGASAGQNITTGNYNLLVGTAAGFSIVSGLGNTGFGFRALIGVTNSYNTGIGYQAFDGTNATESVAIGMNAGNTASAQTNSTLIGAYAGRESTASTSVFLGYGAGYGNTTSGTLAIDYNSSRTANKTALISGIFASQRVGINTPVTSLDANLHVTGSGATSGTFTARFANSTPNYAFSIRNDRAVIFDNLTGTGNRLMQLDATGIAARSTIDPATVVTEASITGTFATSTTSTTLTGTNFCIRMSAATNIVLTVDANMVEGRLYTVRATDNATNTVTISSGAGHTLAVDLDTTLSPTSYVCASAEIVRLVRYGTIIFIDK